MRGDTRFVHAKQLPQFVEKDFEETTRDLLTSMPDCGEAPDEKKHHHYTNLGTLI